MSLPTSKMPSPGMALALISCSTMPTFLSRLATAARALVRSASWLVTVFALGHRGLVLL
jgi:hypothetical protein